MTCVMVIEDDPDIRETVLELLADHALPAVGATDGADALDLLHDPSREKPNLILLDIMMPVMNGFEFRAAQRGDPELAHIPVVVLTAHATAAQAASDLAADGFLKKPFDLDTLLATVRRYCVAQSPP
jgi:CheY-like chemotaxis protein